MTTVSLRDSDLLVYRFETAERESLWLARQLVEQWLRERHVRADAVCDLLLVTNELCTYAHGAGVTMRLQVDGDAVEITVEAGPEPLFDEAAPAGGDLRLAAALVDDLALRVTSGGTVVRCRRHGIVLP